MDEFSDIWIEQCDAAREIRDAWGIRKAFGYLVGEKLLNYIRASDSDPAWAERLPIFVAEIEFSDWTPDGSLRQPVFKGLREPYASRWPSLARIPWYGPFGDGALVLDCNAVLLKTAEGLGELARSVGLKASQRLLYRRPSGAAVDDWTRIYGFRRTPQLKEVAGGEK